MWVCRSWDQWTLLPTEDDNNKVMTNLVIVGIIDCKITFAIVIGWTLDDQGDIDTSCPKVK